MAQEQKPSQRCKCINPCCICLVTCAVIGYVVIAVCFFLLCPLAPTGRQWAARPNKTNLVPTPNATFPPLANTTILPPAANVTEYTQTLSTVCIVTQNMHVACIEDQAKVTRMTLKLKNELIRFEIKVLESEHYSEEDWQKCFTTIYIPAPCTCLQMDQRACEQDKEGAKEKFDYLLYLDSDDILCFFNFFIWSIQIKCFQTKEKPCAKQSLCYIIYSRDFQSVESQGCRNKVSLSGLRFGFTCTTDFCNDPSNYTDVTGELAKPGELKCYSSTNGTLGSLVKCPPDSKGCVVQYSVEITGRFCHNEKQFDNLTMQMCKKNGCNNVKFHNCYEGIAGTCDSVFNEYTRYLPSVKSRNCLELFYPNICVKTKLVSVDGKECVTHSCTHFDGNHYLYFKRNPTAKELMVEEGNITMTITQCNGENCNEPAQRSKVLECWVGLDKNCGENLAKPEKKPCLESKFCYLIQRFGTGCNEFRCDAPGTTNQTFDDDKSSSCFNTSNARYCRCSTNSCQKDLQFEEKPVEISMAEKYNFLAISWIIFLGFSFIFG
uniref:Uncharacterized protein n=2 Tax=Panagrolaimus sp. JU765 TaxID=591449 RepID=A0AC34Q9R0_9BILA